MDEDTQFTELLKTLEAEGKHVWSQTLTGQLSFGYAAQPFPHLALPFGTGISESPMYDALVEGSCSVGEVFERHDGSKWLVVYSNTLEAKLSAGHVHFWIAVEVDRETDCFLKTRTSRDMAIETAKQQGQDEIAKLLEEMGSH